MLESIKNWVIQLNDVANKEINNVMLYVGDESGEPNREHEIQYTIVAIYLGLQKSNPPNAPPKWQKFKGNIYFQMSVFVFLHCFLFSNFPLFFVFPFRLMYRLYLVLKGEREI